MAVQDIADTAPAEVVVPPKKRQWLSPLNQRRWRNFRRNGRAFWSLIIFTVLFTLSLFAEFIANDKPILVSYRGDLHMPIFQFYPETAFGGDFRTEAVYADIEVECLIVTGGLEVCFDDPGQQELLSELHLDFKRACGYSELEISQKRTSLENTLISESLGTHANRLDDIGFNVVAPWFQCFNFASILAIK